MSPTRQMKGWGPVWAAAAHWDATSKTTAELDERRSDVLTQQSLKSTTGKDPTWRALVLRQVKESVLEPPACGPIVHAGGRARSQRRERTPQHTHKSGPMNDWGVSINLREDTLRQEVSRRLSLRRACRTLALKSPLNSAANEKPAAAAERWRSALLLRCRLKTAITQVSAQPCWKLMSDADQTVLFGVYPFQTATLAPERHLIVVSRLLFVLIVPSFNPEKHKGNMKMTQLFQRPDREAVV